MFDSGPGQSTGQTNIFDPLLFPGTSTLSEGTFQRFPVDLIKTGGSVVAHRHLMDSSLTRLVCWGSHNRTSSQGQVVSYSLESFVVRFFGLSFYDIRSRRAATHGSFRNFRNACMPNAWWCNDNTPMSVSTLRMS